MKKTGLVFLLTLVLCFMGSLTAFGRMEGHVFDEAGVYTQEEAADLTSRAEAVGEAYGLDVIFLTTTDTQGLEAREYAAQFFLDGDFGYGEEQDGIVFIIDMGSRDAQMVTSGEAIRIFTDYYIDKIWNEVQPSLSGGAYYDAMSAFLTDVEYYCEEYQKYMANPETYQSEYEKEQESRNVMLYIGISLILALVIAGVSVVFMRKGHNNVKPFTDGSAYLKENGVHFRVNQDSFVTTHTTRKRIVKNDNNNSWGGGSSTFSSGGHDFGGGGGKF